MTVVAGAFMHLQTLIAQLRVKAYGSAFLSLTDLLLVCALCKGNNIVNIYCIYAWSASGAVSLV